MKRDGFSPPSRNPWKWRRTISYDLCESLTQLKILTRERRKEKCGTRGRNVLARDWNSLLRRNSDNVEIEIVAGESD